MDAAYTGNQISARRKELGMTQKNLAEKIHVTDKAVSKWERGVNFPDLGLMETLARELDTTPAALLGLEEASREEILTSMTEISNEQLENAHRDIHRFGWGGLLAAAALIFTYQLFGGKSVERTQNAYMILHCVIVAVAVCGLYTLVKYGQIKKFGVAELFITYGAIGAVAIHLGYHWITGHSIHPVIGFFLIAAAACLVQLLFYRIMTPGFAKALPLLCSAGFALWRMYWLFYVPAVCCLTTWLICFLKNRKKEPIQ